MNILQIMIRDGDGVITLHPQNMTPEQKKAVVEDCGGFILSDEQVWLLASEMCPSIGKENSDWMCNKCLCEKMGYQNKRDGSYCPYSDQLEDCLEKISQDEINVLREALRRGSLEK